MGGHRASVLALVVLAGSAAGCASRQIIDDGGSVSFGPSNAGALLGARLLPSRGAGYRVPPTWQARGLLYGTDELIALIGELGRAIAAAPGGQALAVADLSPASGGRSAWHRSHQTGRDVDLLFFARDAAGRAVAADAMRRFGGDGRALEERGADGRPLPTLVFDDAANWALVRALVVGRAADVQYAFVSDELKQRLLEHAEASGEDPAIVSAAAVLLRQPSDSLLHDDHMHVRILCSPFDRERGCEDAGDLGWRKKHDKYRKERRPPRAPDPPVATTASRGDAVGG